jgi:RNase H-fold protein (predicted Holliday junction resolvase)
VTNRPVCPIIAVDPGREKCGLAVLHDSAVLFRALVPTLEIGPTCAYLLGRHPGAEIVIGNLTCARQVRAAIQAACPSVKVHEADEANTTLEARARYWLENAPRGLWRLVPEGMRVPPRPVDDYAAVLLGERWLAQTPRENP